MSDELLVAVYISPGRWGSECSAGFALHPKIICKDYDGEKYLKKLKIHEYEFKMGLTEHARGEFWEYADNESANLQTLAKIITLIKKKAFPAIEEFKKTPNILEEFDISEMKNFHKNWTKRTGVYVATTDIRFAWAMTIIFENKNLEKAKQFAKWALSQPDNLNSDWFGNKDFERVVTENNGA